MKALKFAVMILAALVLNSCSDKGESIQEGGDDNVSLLKPCPQCLEVEDEAEIPPYVFLYESFYTPMGISFCSHELLLNFRDASGNDLVKGIEFWGNNYPSLSYEVPGGDTHAKGIVKRELHTLDYVYEDSYVESLHPNHSRSMGLRKGIPFSKKYPELDGRLFVFSGIYIWRWYYYWRRYAPKF